MSERRVKISELLLLGSLYITQYMGFSFFVEALVAILRKNGTSLQLISLIYLLGFFWMFKFMWAPLIDRYSPGKRWKYKGWLMLLQFMLVVSLAFTAGFDVGSDLVSIAAIGVAVGFLSSTQDVATDALAYGLLTDKDRGIGNAFKTAGGMLGYMIGGGVGLMLYAYIGWSRTLYFMAAVSAVCLVQLVFFKEPQFKPFIRSSTGYFSYFISFWKNGRISWLFLLMFYPVGISIAYTLIAPILVDHGWGLDSIGLVVNIAGSMVGAVSAFFSGMLIKKMGRKRMLVGLSLLQGAMILFLLIPLYGHTGRLMVAFCVCLILIIYSPSATILSTIMMDQVSGEKPATDYAMQHSLYLFVGFVSGMAGTALAGVFGYVYLIAAASVLCVLAAGAVVLLFTSDNSGKEITAAVCPAVES